MAPDEARIEDVRAWLRKAAFDLRAAEHETSAAEPGLWGDVAPSMPSRRLRSP